jgi:hypothetical protein
MRALLRAEKLWKFRKISPQDTKVSELPLSFTVRPLTDMERV